MLVSGEWFDEKNTDSFEFIERKVYSMTVKNRSYLCISDISGDYIQIGGYADRVTVEVRIYKSSNKFKHYKADVSPIDTTGDEIIEISGANVKVRPTQVLTLKTALALTKLFFENEKLNDNVYWKDMTEMFM